MVYLINLTLGLLGSYIYAGQEFVRMGCKVCYTSHISWSARARALMQWLKLPAWKVGDRGFEPHSGLQVSSPLTRNDSILWGASVTER